MAGRIGIWIRAVRLHTLPLASAGILMGSFMAIHERRFSVVVFVLTLITAILLQILSNLANDYGDSKHGTDNANRQGPKRVVQTGEVSVGQMKRAILNVVILSIVIGCLLIVFSMKNIGLVSGLSLLIVGLLAVWAAYSYTASSKPYGYKGWGDVFVFIFFGLVSVMGAYFIQTGKFEPLVLLPACSIGFFSTAVLNINNIRDIENDRVSGKNSLPVMIGAKNAKIYHIVLLTMGCISLIIYAVYVFESPWLYLFLLPLISFFFNARGVYLAGSTERYTPYLKQLSLFVLITVISFGIALLI